MDVLANGEESAIPAGNSDKDYSVEEFEKRHGEQLSSTLDLDTWRSGVNLDEMYARLEIEVADAVKNETILQKQIRKEIFPFLRARPDAPNGAGVYEAKVEDLLKVHSSLLFNGGVEACDGTVASHDTLPVTITQIGVCLVSYQGDQGSWVHRIFRRDLRSEPGKNPIDEVMELLERRKRREATEVENSADPMTMLARRGIMAYAERAVLLDRSNAVWRMGHGSPAPYELLTGSGMKELAESGIILMRRLIEVHRRFVYVPSSIKGRELITIGNALRPLEYCIIDTLKDRVTAVAEGHYRGESWTRVRKMVADFANDCAPQVVIGMFRAAELAPVQVFFAHVDFAHEAALIAMADSMLQDHRGFPMLLDLADQTCSATFGQDVFTASTQMAYASVGAPYRYMTERSTRH